MSNPFKRQTTNPNDLLSSRLYDQDNFYSAFLRDLSACTHEAIIESPFITTHRMAELLPVFEKLRRRGVRVIINTRQPEEHAAPYDIQAREAVAEMQNIGILVLYTGKHHRKLAVLDKAIIWEGSLNILSYANSCEIMRKITSRELARQMIQFLRLEEIAKENMNV
jgi:phosphatidylserine/phosphatidylglycerophosphate/cardiolipin synthase-like enzyme